MRSEGALTTIQLLRISNHSTSQDFRKYILARNTELLSGTGNVDVDETEWIDFSQNGREDQSFPEISQPSQDDGFENLMAVQNAEVTEIDETDLNDIGILQDDALEYISGYVIRKLNLEEYQCHSNSFTWVDQVSKGKINKTFRAFPDKNKTSKKTLSSAGPNF